MRPKHTQCPECGILSVFGGQPHLIECSKAHPKPHYLLTTEDITKLRNGETVWVEDQSVVILASKEYQSSQTIIAAKPGTRVIHLTFKDLDELLKGHRVGDCGIRIDHMPGQWDH